MAGEPAPIALPYLIARLRRRRWTPSLQLEERHAGREGG
jgi:hypothetical protein